MQNYRSFTTLNHYENSIYFQKNKIKVRLFNTNEAFASIKACLPKDIKLQKTFIKSFSNVTTSQTDYINSLPSGNRKIDLIVHPHNETPENYRLAIELAKHSMTPTKYSQLISFIEGL